VWLDQRSPEERRRIESATNVDLDAVEAELNNLDHVVFDVSDELELKVERILKTFVLVAKHEIVRRFKEAAPEWNLDDKLPDFDCYETCVDIPSPSSVVSWIFDTMVDLGEQFADAIVDIIESALSIRLPGWLSGFIRKNLAQLVFIGLLLALIGLGVALGLFEGASGGAGTPVVGAVVFLVLVLMAGLAGNEAPIDVQMRRSSQA